MSIYYLGNILPFKSNCREYFLEKFSPTSPIFQKPYEMNTDPRSHDDTALHLIMFTYFLP